MVPKLLLFAVLAGVLWAPSEGVTPFRKCTLDIPAPEMVQVNDCETNTCIIKAGSISNMTVKFTAVNTTQTVFAQVIVYVNGNSVPLPIPDDNANACNHLADDAKCPLNAGDTATYNLRVPVDRGLPDMFVATEVALVGDDGNCIACFVTDVKLESERRPSDSSETSE